MKEGHKGAESETPAVDLRSQAEKIARAEEAQTREAMTPEETRQTLHELRVHQIELEMQNEELRRAQAELEAARARYFDLYDLAPVGYCTLNEKGLILEANLTIVAMLGMVRGDLVKQPLSRFILKEYQEIYYLHRKLLFETGESPAYELQMVKKDGTAFWARQEATVAQDASTLRPGSAQASSGQDADGAPVCRIVMSNITERKRAEEALRGSEKRYHKLFESMTSGFALHEIILDEGGKPSDYRFLDVNPAFEQLTGWKAADLIGRTVRDALPESEIFWTETYGRVAATGEPFHFENYSEKLDRYFEVTVYEPEPGRYASMFQDITGRKRVEEALQQAHDGLEQRVAERTEE